VIQPHGHAQKKREFVHGGAAGERVLSSYEVPPALAQPVLQLLAAVKAGERQP
jgi:hypothetical protein